ncbi:MAG: hypothetical protein IJB61_05195 [Bacteroides sp]|nr:hypothetical protein [Bacteroides sp.]
MQKNHQTYADKFLFLAEELGREIVSKAFGGSKRLHDYVFGGRRNGRLQESCHPLIAVIQ